MARKARCPARARPWRRLRRDDLVVSRVIAIAGAKGSPGCSFLAVALARHLAASQVSTLLLDADAEGGGLAALLDIGSADMIHGSPVDKPAMQVDQNLWFVEIGQPVAEFNGLEWMGSARVEHEAVIVDLGHSAGTLQRQLSGRRRLAALGGGTRSQRLATCRCNAGVGPARFCQRGSDIQPAAPRLPRRG